MSHRHDWIDATNEVVTKTAWCPCGTIAELKDVKLTTKSLTKLRKDYPHVNWKKDAA